MSTYPSKDPVDPLISTTDGVMLLKDVPIIGTPTLAVIQAALVFL